MPNSLWDSKLISGLLQPAADKWNRLSTFTERADGIAEKAFPDSARDASTKNAFRHALGTGMLTQELGGGPIAATLAKMAGWGWEGLGAGQLMDSPQYRLDTRHDLNANNIGASVAMGSKNEAELVARLKQLASVAAVEQPPGFFEPPVPRLTRTVR